MWHDGPEVRHPETRVKTTGEHRLPEHEFQFGDDLAGGLPLLPSGQQVGASVVPLRRVREALYEA